MIISSLTQSNSYALLYTVWKHWCCRWHCTGVIALAAALASLPLLHCHCVPCCASIVVAVASMPSSRWCSHCHPGWDCIKLAFLLPSCLSWLIVVSPLDVLFSLHRCLLMHSLCLQPPICLMFSLAGCRVTSCYAASALHRLLSRCRLSSMCWLVIALPLLSHCLRLMSALLMPPPLARCGLAVLSPLIIRGNHFDVFWEASNI